ncbi:glycosyltransferase [Aegicerativicinus sediminis]|uniref:glycosyltransferase n=1 Tax=Aegicerativicinus sediminis TaxID=2893202 RepID=UPI001E45F7D0|nr:glycosyltransferase [Aegicerativicinus sediminis]
MKLDSYILYAPLNWGLGHATRSIPIINHLIENGFSPIIASDGEALELLKKEFPNLNHEELPSYRIKYSKKKEFFKYKLLLDTPKIISAAKAERKATAALSIKYPLSGIISDNRMGVWHPEIPSAFITHQLQVLSGSTTRLTTAWHQRKIARFNECWVPDLEEEPNLSGCMGHTQLNNIKLKYIGVLSRFEKLKIKKKYDLLAIISGPEPQRSLIENILVEELKHYEGSVLIVRGKIEESITREEQGNITIQNYMTTKELEIAINESDLVISRSGYTTLMDLAKLGKKAFFIPTPGQFEQEYLAERLQLSGVAPFCNQNDFSVSQLSRVSDFSGFVSFTEQPKLNNLFTLFQSEREFTPNA